MPSKHRPCSQCRTDRRRFPGKRAKRDPPSMASPDKDTPHHVADGSEKKTPLQQIPGSRRAIAGAPSCQEKFQHIRHEQHCGHTEKVEPVMESVLLLPSHTNSDLRYCAQEI